MDDGAWRHATYGWQVPGRTRFRQRCGGLSGDSQVVRSILLIEDNPMDVELTLRAFQQNRVANPVTVARNSEEALAWIPRWESGESKPAMILLDVNMPRVNGLELLKELRTHAVSANIPVIMLTTSSTGREIETAYEHGANSYIVKPVDFEKFRDVAEQIRHYWTVLNVPAP